MCRALDEMFEESTNKGIQMGIKQGIELNQFEVYQTMLDKGFSVKDIASIFSVSEESIKEFFDLCLVKGTNICILIFLVEI